MVLRGNVDTRLAKLDAGACDATVLAAAGLERLGLESRIRARLAPADMLPAIGQGIVGIECVRSGRTSPPSCVPSSTARRARCSTPSARSQRGSARAATRPIAGYATLDGGTLRLDGLVGSPDGRSIIVDAVSGAVRDAAAIGAELAERLLAAGAGKLL